MSNKPVTASMLADELAGLIQAARQQAAVTVNRELTLLYWKVGSRIHHEVLKGERADYGKQLVEGLSKSLSVKFGRGWSRRNLFQMVKFAELFPKQEIVQTLSAQLSWSHFVQLSAIEDSLKREFYTAMAAQERWSTRTLAQGSPLLRARSGSRSIAMTFTSTYFSTIASSSAWSQSISSWKASSMVTRVRWSFICGGCKSTKPKQMNSHLWGSFCALAKSRSKSSY